jgi:hypothetical protein
MIGIPEATVSLSKRHGDGWNRLGDRPRRTFLADILMSSRYHLLGAVSPQLSRLCEVNVDAIPTGTGLALETCGFTDWSATVRVEWQWSGICEAPSGWRRLNNFRPKAKAGGTRPPLPVRSRTENRDGTFMNLRVRLCVHVNLK